MLNFYTKIINLPTKLYFLFPVVYVTYFTLLFKLSQVSLDFCIEELRPGNKLLCHFTSLICFSASSRSFDNSACRSLLQKFTLFNDFRRKSNKVCLPNMSIHSLRHTHSVLMNDSASRHITNEVYAHTSKINQMHSIDNIQIKF